MSLFTSPKRKRQDNEDREKEAQPLSIGHLYACKLCDKKFSTSQALGDHRATHKNRNKIVAGLASGDSSKEWHTCSICFEKFLSGQALGGHMRKHLIAQEEKAKPEFLKEKTVSEHDRMYLTSKSDSSFWVNMVKDKTMCDNSTLVTRDFFPREPVRGDVEKVQKDIVSLLPLRAEGGGSWLDLKLGPPGGDYNKD